MHLVLCLVGLPLRPLDLGPARGVGVPLGLRLAWAGLLPLLLLLQEEEERELPAHDRRPFPASPSLWTLPNSHRTFHDVRIRGSLQSLAPALYPPEERESRKDKRARSREVSSRGRRRRSRSSSRSRSRGRERGRRSSSASRSSRGRSRRERSRSSDRYRSRRGSSRSRRDRSRSSDRYRSRRDRSRRERSRSFDRYRRERARSPACRGERRDRSRSHALPNRSRDRSRSSVRLTASPARLRAEEAGRLARRGAQEGVEALASQPSVASGETADVTPVAGGASMTALPSAMRELAKFFLNLSGSSSLGATGTLRV